VSTQGLKKTYFPYLLVMITAVNNKGGVKVYNVASKHGYIRGTFIRDDHIHLKNYNAHTLNFSTEVEGFKKNLSLQKACNEVALGTSCNCSGVQKTLDVHVRQQAHSVHHCATVVEGKTKSVLYLRTYVAPKHMMTSKKRSKIPS
jgi:hypothetical protein